MPIFVRGCAYVVLVVLICLLTILKKYLLMEENTLFCSKDPKTDQAYRCSQITKNNAS